MAEDLGTIKIAFGDAGRGPSETQAAQKSPERVAGEEKQKAAKEGAAAAGAGEAEGESGLAALGPEVEAAVEGVKMVVDAIGAFRKFVIDGIQKLIEGGKYSAGTMKESMLIQMQDLRQQMTVARLTDPLATKALQNWRELMSMLMPWRATLMALLSSSLSAIIGIVKAFEPLITSLAQMTLTAFPMVLGHLQGLSKIASYLTGERIPFAQDLQKFFARKEGEGGPLSGVYGKLSELGLYFAPQGGTFTDIGDSLETVIQQFKDAKLTLDSIKRNTQKDREQSDLLGEDLRMMAQISTLYRERSAGIGAGSQKDFWRPIKG